MLKTELVFVLTVLLLSVPQTSSAEPAQPAAGEVQLQNYVVTLNEANYNQTVLNTDNVIVMFNSPMDPKSGELLPIFQEAAYNAKQQGNNVVFAQVIINEEKDAERWQLEKLPTFYYYSYGNRYNYNGDKTVKGFFKFLQYELSRNFTEYYLNETSVLNNTEMIGDKNQSLLLFVGDPNVHFKDFLYFRRVFEESGKYLMYFWTNEAVFLNQFNIPQNGFGLALFEFFNSRNEFGQGRLLDLSNLKLIKRQLRILSKPVLDDLDENVLEKILKQGISGLVLVYGKGVKEAGSSFVQSFVQNYTPIVEQHRDSLWSLKTDIHDSYLEEFYKLFRLNSTQVPTAIIIDNPLDKDSDIAKYKYNYTENGPLTPETLVQFIENWRNGQLEKFVVSEPVAENPYNEFGVFHVVAENFKEFLNFTTNSFLLVCSDEKSDETCEESRRRFNAVSRRFNSSSDVTFAFFDPVKNPSDLTLDYIPDLLFFPKGTDKIKKMTLFQGNFTTNEIAQFLHNSVSGLVEVPASDEETQLINQEQALERRRIEEDDHQDDENNDNQDQEPDQHDHQDQEHDQHDHQDEEPEDHSHDEEAPNTQEAGQEGGAEALEAMKKLLEDNYPKNEAGATQEVGHIDL